jgi:hypothetical protein
LVVDLLDSRPMLRKQGFDCNGHGDYRVSRWRTSGGNTIAPGDKSDGLQSI